METKDKIKTLTNEFLGTTHPFSTLEEEKQVLYGIVSDSIKATNYVITIEDEFDIEIEDEELDLRFFSSIDRIVEIVNKYKN